METRIIDGKAIAQQIREEIREQVAILKEKGTEITLAVVLVGEDPASKVYVRNKKNACEFAGIISREILLPADITQEALLDTVRQLNEDPAVNGILVQLPLPKGLDADAVIRAIAPEKDVDGFHPQSVGALSIGLPGFVSCTPAGIIELLRRRRQADGHAHAARERHCDDRPFQNKESPGSHFPRRYPDYRGRQGQAFPRG